MVLRYRIMIAVFTIVVTNPKGRDIIGPNLPQDEQSLL